MRVLHSWIVVALVLFAGLWVLACDESAQSDGTDDDEVTAFTCETDVHCMRTTTNMTCHSTRKVCVDHGLCSEDARCQVLFGPLKPYCGRNGLCTDVEPGEDDQDGDYNPGTDGDSNNPGTDGDTNNPGTDGDDADGDWPNEDGDVDWDFEEPELEFDPTPVPCSNNPSLDAPSIVVEPNVADFGAVPIGDSQQVRLTICNAGGQDMAITGLRFGRGTSNEFFKYHDDLPITVRPGFAAPVLLLYVPFDNVADTGKLEILSNDRNRPEVVVNLISSVKAAPYVRALPQTVQFSGATPGRTLTKVLELRNVGLASTSISHLSPQLGANSPYSILEVISASTNSPVQAPWMLGPDQAIMVTIAMKMGETPIDDVLYVPWITEGGERRTRVDLVTGDMAICAVAVTGPDQVVDPLDVVYLDGRGSYDPNGAILGYKWEWVTKPPDAHRAVLIDRNGAPIAGVWTMEATPSFYAELAGEYMVRLSVKDDEPGCTGVNTDQVYIIAKPQSTIHVQIMWSHSGNDQDLHLVRPGGNHSRSSSGNTTDCHYANCNTMNGMAWDCPMRGCPGPMSAPDWGQIGQRMDDPTLDIDDIDGKGPENINLSLPELGDYLVSVENFSGQNTSLEVTARIYIFGVLRETYVRTHWPVQKYWRVAWVRVNSATDIEIVEINDVCDSGGNCQ